MPAPSSCLSLALSAVLVACGGDLTLPGSDGGGDGSPTGPATPSTPSLSAADDRFSTVEGGSHTLTIAAPGVLGNDQVNGLESATLEAVVVDGPLQGRLDLRADGSLDYTPEPDWFGSDRFTYRARYEDAESAPAEVLLVVQAVNDAPRFTPGPDQQVERRDGERELEHWAGDIAPGPANESDQQVTFVVTVLSGEKVLDGTPEISSSGTLRYRPSHHHGTAVVQVVLQDDGGTANGGTDTAPAHTLTITVTR
jgi:hypothetical protein